MKALFSSPLFHKALGFAVSIGLLVWIIATTNWTEVGEAFRNAHLFFLVPCLLIMAVHIVIRSYRWRFLLPVRTPPAPLNLLVDAYMLGSFATYVLPLRAGEFIRPLLLCRHSSYKYPTALVSIIVERFFDLVAVLVSFGVIALFIPEIPPLLFKGASLLAVAGGCILIFMIGGTLFPKLTATVAHWGLRFFPQSIQNFADKIIHDIFDGLSVLKSVSALLKIVGLTILVWGSCYLLFWSFLFLLDLPTSPWVGVSVAVILALAVAAPSAPGFLGVYQAGCIMAFALFGVPKEPALAYAIITHIIHYFVNVSYGILVLLKYDMRFGELTTKRIAEANRI